MKLSVYIIAYNEEDKIEQALKSVDWADEIIVADSFSTDATVEIAQKFGAEVVQIPFNGFGDLRNKAIDACRHDWIFSLDSDERCTEQARKEIEKIICAKDHADAYFVPRRNYFLGRWIKHSGFYPDYRQPQLFKRGSLRFRPDMVHEGYDVISDKKCGYLKSDIYQIPYKNIEEMMSKANRYSTLGAEKLEQTGRTSGLFNALMHGVWSAFSIFILRLGFLDGWPGFIIALGNFEGTFYKYVKLHWKNKAMEYQNS